VCPDEQVTRGGGGGRVAQTLVVRWAVLLIVLAVASVAFLHDGGHVGQAHAAPGSASSTDHCADDGNDDGAASSDHCASSIVCKVCATVAEMTVPTRGTPLRYVWDGVSFTAQCTAPNRKPPKLIVRV